MTEKIRADVALVKKNLCDSRERAQAAIMEGRVFFGNRRINKASEMIDESETLVIRNPENDYVSRGALKLEKAIRVFDAKLDGKTVMDIGSSTGGFTDVCLRNGATHVYSIDVGYGQLDWKLRNDPRVTVMERTNARYLEKDMFPVVPSITVMDVSFISIRLIIPTAQKIMGEEGIFYTLIKPQFEAGRKHVGKNGVVRDAEVHKHVINEIAGFVSETGWLVTAIDYSPITGPKGNIEFLAEIRHKHGNMTGVLPEQISQTVREAHENMLHL